MRKPLPLGIDSFRELRRGNYYYVDKTQCIEEFFNQGAKVTLITRPRRFGKTLTMDMMKEFLNIEGNSRELFESLKVMQTPAAAEMNQWPVVHFSFKDCMGDLSMLVLTIKDELRREYIRHKAAVPFLEEEQKEQYQAIMRCLQSEDQDFLPIRRAIAFLSEMVFRQYQKEPIILIDEYDTPMITAYEAGCQKNLRPFFTSLYATAFKGNPFLRMALLTGIQRVAKENIFSGLNNLLVCTMEQKNYADCFGFTPEETESLLREYGLSLTDEVKAMYDGYRIGGRDVYNPWSIVNYASSGELSPYWVNTSSNSLIRSNLRRSGQEFRQKFDELILTGETAVNVDLQTAYFEQASPAALWGLFVNAGYAAFADSPTAPSPVRKLKIPNKEVLEEFKEMVTDSSGLSKSLLDEMFYYLVTCRDIAAFAKVYQQIITSVTSYYDGKENAYHMLLLGMCVYLSGRYEIRSNLETGHGRCDILLKAKNPEDSHIIIELKQGEDLSLLANQALRQIKDNQYYSGLRGDAILMGIAHDKKRTEIVWEVLENSSRNNA